MRAEAFPELGAEPDTSRAKALVAAMHEYDPATDGEVGRPGRSRPQPEPEGLAEEVPQGEAPPAPEVAAAPVRALASVTDSTTRQDETRSGIELPPGAAWFAVREPVEAGDLLALDPANPATLRRAASIADPGAVGVAIGKTRTANGEIAGAGEAAVLTFGVARVKVDAGFGAIVPGDLLTSSPTPGHALRAAEIVPGTILGKALEPLDVATGTIRVLLMQR